MTLTQTPRSTPIGSISFSDGSSTTSARPSRPATCSSATGSASTGRWPTARSSHTSWRPAPAPPPRYVAEWLRGQAAGGYVSYDPETRRTRSAPSSRPLLTDPDGAVFLPGAFQLALGSAPGRAAGRRGLPHRRRASAGTSTTPTCSLAASGSSAPATPPTWSPPGCRRWTGSRPSCGTASRSPTSAAGTAPPPC